MIPLITIFVRHSQDCPHSGDEFYKRCNCRKHLRYTLNGRQRRATAKTRSWHQAERAKRELGLRLESRSSHPVSAPQQPKTIEYAIEAFLKDKQGGQTSKETLAKYRLTLSRLQHFMDRHDILFMRDISLDQLSAWRAEWDKYYSTVFAIRNEQSRVRAFFTYAQKAGIIYENPAAKLSTIRVADEDYKVDPFTPQQYEKILSTIQKCGEITLLNRRRIKALMQLQRWAGLSLIDAVCLSRPEIARSGKNYRLDTRRRKTGTRVMLVIPGWLGKEMHELENGNAQYFFWTGESTPKSARSRYDKLYRKVFRRAGIAHAGSHRFRHLFAVWALGAGIDMRTVSRCLGHKSLAVTERFYAAWDRKQQKNLERELVRAWRS